MSTMNPFLENLCRYRVEHLLQVKYSNSEVPCNRSIHSSQAHLKDREVQSQPCIFSNDLCLIVGAGNIDPELAARCGSEGTVIDVTYAVLDADTGRFIGGTYTLDGDHALVDHLAYRYEPWSRSWEISKSHIPLRALHTLLESFGTKMLIRLAGVLIGIFWIDELGSVGFRLVHTPWTDENLEVMDLTASALREEQIAAGYPAELVDLLHLAAQADIRYLVLDPFAPTLKGLPLYDD
ncbi:ABC transporter substrate-binding protein [Pseudomonas aeruginosa]